MPVVCDVSDEQQVVAAVQKVVDHWEKIDILINNAGAIKVTPTVELKAEGWQNMVKELFRINTLYPQLLKLPKPHVSGLFVSNKSCYIFQHSN